MHSEKKPTSAQKWGVNNSNKMTISIFTSPFLEAWITLELVIYQIPYVDFYINIISTGKDYLKF